MWSELLTAVALVLILEGIMPFMNPDGLQAAIAALRMFRVK